MSKDKRIAWDVSKFDWWSFRQKFEDTIPDDNSQRINYSINHIPHVVSALLVNLNKRVEELEHQLSHNSENE